MAVVVTAALRPATGVYLTDGAALVMSIAAAGCALFSATFAIPPAYVGTWRRAARALALGGFGATLLTVAATVADVAGTGVRGLADTTAGDAVLRGGVYQSALTRCIGLCAVVVVFSLPRPHRLLLVGAGVVTSGSFLLTGHVRDHGPAAVVVICALAHVVAAAAWLGGLVGISVVARANVDALARARTLRQFAGVMTGVVAMLLAGGAGLGMLYLSSPAALVTTAYGQVLIVKVGLVIAVLLASLANHRRFVPLSTRGDARALVALRMNVAVEQIGVIAVLLVTEVLMRQNPAT